MKTSDLKSLPILIPTLCRSAHFRNCVESLAQCRHAADCDLIVGLDYPAKEMHVKGYEEIKAYLPQIKGFRKVIVFERDTNWGAVRNYHDLCRYAAERYPALIITEDDNVFAPSFLEFMISALLLTKDNPDCTSVCGYTVPEMADDGVDFYRSHDNSAWGYGVWSDRLYIPTLEEARAIYRLPWKAFRIWRRYPACLQMLGDMLKKGALYGDTVRTSNNILGGTYQLRPGNTLVRNMGHDGTGVNCGVDSGKFSRQRFSSRGSYLLTSASVGKDVPLPALLFQGLEATGLRSIVRIVAIWVRYLSNFIKSEKR